ncbi:MAG: ABC transporter permease [Fibrobacterota bacterium]
MMFRIGWRNIFRNSRRTIITAAAIGMGIASLIFTDGFMKGMVENLIQNATNSFLGDGQVHSRAYMENPKSKYTIARSDSLAAALTEDARISAVSSRLVSPGMLSSAENFANVQVWGVHPAQERAVTLIDDRLSPESAWLPAENSLVIGQALADKLGVSRGNHLVLNLADAETGQRQQHYMKIDGIYSFGSDNMDRRAVLIRHSLAAEMLGTGEGSANEVAFAVHDLQEPGLFDNLRDAYSTEQSELQSWKRLMPELAGTAQMTDFSMLIIGGILFLIVSFTVINTLFMSIYERFFEFGVLKAIGTTDGQIIRMVLYEALSLSLISSLLGIILGGIFLALLNHFGINYNDIEFSGMTFYEKIYPVITVQQFILYPAVISALTVLISLYPALYIGRMAPAEITRKAV